MSPTSHTPHPPLVGSGQITLFAADMTAVVAADVTLDQLQHHLASVNQWLPIDGPGHWSVGDLVDANSTGPLRLGYGAWRDLLLGLQFVNGSDQLVTAGGRTMKNVAGYDLTKFLVGQAGCFGTLLTVTIRTYLRPVGALLAELDPNPDGVAPLLAGPLRPHWAALTDLTLYCGYLGDEPTLAHYQSALAAAGIANVARTALDADIHLRQGLWPICDDPVLRVSVPPAAIGDFLRQAGHPYEWVADPAFGLVLVPLSETVDTAALRQAALALGGSVFISEPQEHGLVITGLTLDPTQRQLLQRLKAAFDPDNRLQPLPEEWP